MLLFKSCGFGTGSIVWDVQLPWWISMPILGGFASTCGLWSLHVCEIFARWRLLVKFGWLYPILYPIVAGQSRLGQACFDFPSRGKNDVWCLDWWSLFSEVDKHPPRVHYTLRQGQSHPVTDLSPSPHSLLVPSVCGYRRPGETTQRRRRATTNVTNGCVAGWPLQLRHFLIPDLVFTGNTSINARSWIYWISSGGNWKLLGLETTERHPEKDGFCTLFFHLVLLCFYTTWDRYPCIPYSDISVLGHYMSAPISINPPVIFNVQRGCGCSWHVAVGARWENSK